MSAPEIYPPPPPPPAPKVSKDGIPLPTDRTTCPIFLQKRTNPAMAAVSGYVFCYPCIFNYVSQVRLSILYTYGNRQFSAILSGVYVT
jgi:peroxin-12